MVVSSGFWPRPPLPLRAFRSHLSSVRAAERTCVLALERERRRVDRMERAEPDGMGVARRRGLELAKRLSDEGGRGHGGQQAAVEVGGRRMCMCMCMCMCM